MASCGCGLAGASSTPSASQIPSVSARTNMGLEQLGGLGLSIATFHARTNLGQVFANIRSFTDASVSDTGVRDIASHFLSPVHHLTSGILLQEKFNLDGQQMQSRISRLAAGLLCYQRCVQAELEQRLSDQLPTAKKVLCIEFCSYDETAKKTRVRDNPSAPLDNMLAEAPDSQTGLQCSTEMPTLASHKPAQPIVAKLLQVQHRGCYLIKLASGEHVVLLTEALQPIQCMQTTSAEVLLRCLLQATGQHPQLQGWQQCSRVVCTDKAASNMKTERALLRERGESHHWSTLHQGCNVHGLACCFKRTYEALITRDVTGLIHTALALASSTAMVHFRAAMKQVVGQRLVMYKGRVSSDAVSHKVRVVRAYMDTASDTAARQFLLLSVLNGDWRVDTEVQIYQDDVSRPSQVHRDDVLNLVVHVLHECVLATVSQQHGPGTAGLEHRSQSMIWESYCSCIGLLLPVFQVFVQMVDGQRGLVSVDPALVPGDHDDDWQHQNEHAPALPVAAGVADAEPVVGHVGVSAETYPSAPSLDYAAQNSKDRRVALQWLESKPLAAVSVVRASMHPLCDYMCKQLSLGSVKWEQTAMLSNVSPAGVGSLTLRDFPLTIASEGTLNQAYFAELQTLFFSSAPWQAVPLHSWDVSLCSLAFRLAGPPGMRSPPACCCRT